MKPKKILVGLFMVHLCNTQLAAQIQQLNLSDQNFGCSYDGKSTSKIVYAFETNSEAVEIIKQIVAQQGLEPNFRIFAADVYNAEARIIDEERVIIYNQNFIHDVRKATGSDWAATSILAHEVAHHLQGHTIKQGGSRPDLELEADKFSGFILYKLGATLEEAQLAINTFGSSVGSATHPAKSDRLQAIAVGWSDARQLENKKTNISDNTSNTIEGKKEKIDNLPPKEPVNDNPTNHTEDQKDLAELENMIHPENKTTTSRTTFQYLGNALLATQANVQILINNVWYTPPSNQFYIDNIPYGNTYYQIYGTLTVTVEGFGSYQVAVNNNGYINIGQNSIFYILVDFNYLTLQYSMRLSPVNY